MSPAEKAVRAPAASARPRPTVHRPDGGHRLGGQRRHVTEPEAGLQGVNRRHIHYDSAARDAHSQRIRGTMDENA